MASGLLSLKWNNHRSTFFHVLSSIRSKESYCDATLACDGRFYPVHKLVLSTCSEYFEQIFERTQCKHPVIVLKDIKYDDLEALMNYMYVGEVNVLQEKLSGLIKAAECLKIKGLAVPDEDPLGSRENRRNQYRSEFESPRAKRRRRDSLSYEERGKRISSRDTQPAHREHLVVENHNIEDLASPVLAEASCTQGIADAFTKSKIASEEEIETQGDDGSGEQPSSKQRSNEDATKRISSQKRISDVSLEETNVKTEPPDIEVPDDDDVDSKEKLHSDLGYDPSADGDSRGADEGGSTHGGSESDYSNNVMESAPQSVEDVVAQALPSSSNFQGNSFSLWEGEGSLQNFPGEGFSGENSQGRQMVENASYSIDSFDKNGNSVTDKFSDSLSHLAPSLRHFTAIREISSASNLQAEFGGLSNSEKPKSQNPITFSGGIMCSVCNKVFRSAIRLKTHYRTHTGEKPFDCSVCSFRTSVKSNLVAHMMRHTGEKSYECKICSLQFTNRCSLMYHTVCAHEQFSDTGDTLIFHDTHTEPPNF